MVMIRRLRTTPPGAVEARGPFVSRSRMAAKARSFAQVHNEEDKTGRKEEIEKEQISDHPRRLFPTPRSNITPTHICNKPHPTAALFQVPAFSSNHSFGAPRHAPVAHQSRNRHLALASRSNSAALRLCQLFPAPARTAPESQRHRASPISSLSRGPFGAHLTLLTLRLLSIARNSQSALPPPDPIVSLPSPKRCVGEGANHRPIRTPRWLPTAFVILPYCWRLTGDWSGTWSYCTTAAPLHLCTTHSSSH